MTLRAFLDLPDGMAIRIGPSGLLIGRHRTCDLQLAAETASRRHALLRVADTGVELVVLGRHSVEVDDTPVTTTATLANGARLGLPGLACRIRIETADDAIPIEYVLRRGHERFPIRTSPFVVGGDASANVIVDGWLPPAMRVWVAQGEVSADLGDGTHMTVQEGDTLDVRGQTFVIERAADDSASTVSLSSERRLRGVVLEPLPRGGRVTLQFSDGDRTLYLPGRRYALVAALVVPPAPLAAGDFVPDSELVPLVWPDTDEVGGRTEINVVLARTRQDLVAAGIASARLLERAPGGRATRIVLAPGAVIHTVE